MTLLKDMKRNLMKQSNYMKAENWKQTTLTTIINNLRYKYSVEKGVKALQKYSTYEPAIGIKKTGSVYNPDRKDKQFHIMCKITLDVEYLSGKKIIVIKRIKKHFQNLELLTQKHWQRLKI